MFEIQTKYNRTFTAIGECESYPDSITDQTCLTVRQQVERFMATGELPPTSSVDSYYDDDGVESADKVVTPYGLSDPVDIADYAERATKTAEIINGRQKSDDVTDKSESFKTSGDTSPEVVAEGN